MLNKGLFWPHRVFLSIMLLILLGAGSQKIEGQVDKKVPLHQMELSPSDTFQEYPPLATGNANLVLPYFSNIFYSVNGKNDRPWRCCTSFLLQQIMLSLSVWVDKEALQHLFIPGLDIKKQVFPFHCFG